MNKRYKFKLNQQDMDLFNEVVSDVEPLNPTHKLAHKSSINDLLGKKTELKTPVLCHVVRNTTTTNTHIESQEMRKTMEAHDASTQTDRNQKSDAPCTSREKQHALLTFIAAASTARHSILAPTEHF